MIESVEKGISSIMGIPMEHGEGLHVLHYKPGQEYKDHVDYFASTSKTLAIIESVRLCCI